MRIVTRLKRRKKAKRVFEESSFRGSQVLRRHSRLLTCRVRVRIPRVPPIFCRLQVLRLHTRLLSDGVRVRISGDRPIFETCPLVEWATSVTAERADERVRRSIRHRKFSVPGYQTGRMNLSYKEAGRVRFSDWVPIFVGSTGCAAGSYKP